jgi:hypothetical protein
VHSRALSAFDSPYVNVSIEKSERSSSLTR